MRITLQSMAIMLIFWLNSHSHRHYTRVPTIRSIDTVPPQHSPSRSSIRLLNFWILTTGTMCIGQEETIFSLFFVFSVFVQSIRLLCEISLMDATACVLRGWKVNYSICPISIEWLRFVVKQCVVWIAFVFVYFCGHWADGIKLFSVVVNECDTGWV